MVSRSCTVERGSRFPLPLRRVQHPHVVKEVAADHLATTEEKHHPVVGDRDGDSREVAGNVLDAAKLRVLFEAVPID